jgi:hypothetical protein
MLEMKRHFDEHPRLLNGVQSRKVTQGSSGKVTPLEYTYFMNLFFGISFNSLVLMFIYCERTYFVAELMTPEKHTAIVRNYRPLFRYVQYQVSNKH